MNLGPQKFATCKVKIQINIYLLLINTDHRMISLVDFNAENKNSHIFIIKIDLQTQGKIVIKRHTVYGTLKKFGKGIKMPWISPTDNVSNFSSWKTKYISGL